MDLGRLFLNIGFRVDKQSGTSDIGRTTFDKTVFSPRLSAKFDVTGDGNTLALANYGRFYQSVIQSFADGFAGVPQQTNHTEEVYDPTSGQYVFAFRNEEGGNSQPVNTGLKPSYCDDFTLGIEHRFGRVIGVSLKGNYRKWKDLIDDVRTLTGTTRTIDYVNLDEATRRYRGLEFVVDKRFANNWSAYASYTLSRTEGNHFADFASDLGDYYAKRRRGGRQRLHRQFGEQVWPRLVRPHARRQGLRRVHAGARQGHAHPRPHSRLALRPDLPAAGDPERRWLHHMQFDTPRGSDRFPSQFYSNFAFQADFRLFGDVGVGAKLDVFNATNTQTKISGSATDNANYGKATSSANYAVGRQLQFTFLITF